MKRLMSQQVSAALGLKIARGQEWQWLGVGDDKKDWMWRGRMGAGLDVGVRKRRIKSDPTAVASNNEEGNGAEVAVGRSQLGSAGQASHNVPARDIRTQ